MKEIFEETEKKLQDLEKEVKKKEKEFWQKFKDLEKRKIDVDEDLLKEFMSEYWYINHSTSNDDEYEIIVPRWLNFSVGWLSHTTKGYNVFKVNKYTQWLGQIPDFLRKELQIPEALKVLFDGENVIFNEGNEETISERFGANIESISRGTARVKKGHEFDLIASIIESGSMPFIPKEVDKADLRSSQLNFNFDGKYSFQNNVYKTFLKYGAIGVYWMTGAGKSFLSMKVLDSLKGEKLLVVPTTTLVEHWKEYFAKYAPRLKNEVQIITYQGYEKAKNKEFMITVFDECHVLPANTFSKLATLKTKYRLGLSATPYREDERTNYIFALTGYPVGLDWQHLMKILGKKYHDINVHIVSDINNKIKLTESLLNKEQKTIIFVNKIDIGNKIADKLGIPFIHGGVKNRMEIARDNTVFVASRVMELGVSLKDLVHVIEVDFLFGSKREEVQRTGRLFHSDTGKYHDIIFTKEEFEKYGKRLHGLIEKGFRINLKPNIQGNFKIRKNVKISKKVSTLAGKGVDLLAKLFEDGYFVDERSFKDVLIELNKRGAPTNASIHKNAIGRKINSLVKNKLLYKIKRGHNNWFVQR